MIESATDPQLPLILADLPIDLAELITFVLLSPQTQAFIKAATNTFFEPRVSSDPSTGAARTAADGGEPRPTVQTRKEGGCWGVLPLDWRGFFDRVPLDEREDLLRDFANGGAAPDDLPPSLSSYLATCRRLSLPRECSDTPILSFPPRPSPPSPPPASPAAPPTPSSRGSGKKQGKQNAIRAGQSPKKAHEVARFSSLARSILSSRDASTSITHCLDVGSGRAHLSRALAAPPLSLHVLAVDWSASQIEGAEYLDGLKERGAAAAVEGEREGEGGAGEGRGQGKGDKRHGSLTHRTSALDAEGIEELMRSWPAPPPALAEEGAGEREEEEKGQAMLVALHACGDLTIDAIKAFIADSTSHSQTTSNRTAILCGCCYNLQTPSIFPLSSLLSSLPSPLPPPFPPTPSTSSIPTLGDSRPSLDRQHLLLTAQAPSTWYSPVTPSSFPLISPLPTGDALKKSLLKLAYRARLEAELSHAGLGSQGERRVGRVGECRGGWSEYRKRALARYGEGEVEELEFEGGEEGWAEALWKLQIFWTLRSLLGPLLEGMLVLDRWVYLVEGLARAGEWQGEGGRTVELVSLFDQRTGSLRNLAMVVR